MVKQTKLSKSFLAAVASGCASVDEMRRAGDDAVFNAKTSDDLTHFRDCVRAAHMVADKARTRSYVFSDQSKDRMGDVIIQSGWALDNFKANPVVLWAHNSYAPPIGLAAKVRKARVDGIPALIGDVTFADEEVNPEAELIWRMVEAGIIKTTSVGFRALEASYGDEITSVERKKYDLGAYSVIYRRQDLMEHSITSVPANANATELNGESSIVERALRDMVRDGTITDQRAAHFLDVYPATEEAALERTKAAVRSIVDFAKNLSDEEPDDDQAAPPESPERESADDPVNTPKAGTPETPEGDSTDGAATFTCDEVPEEIETRIAAITVCETDADDVRAIARSCVEIGMAARPAVEALEMPAVIDNTETLTPLASALAKMVEAQTEQITAVRQLTDVVHDLARRGINEPAVEQAPEASLTEDGGADAHVDQDEAVERAAQILAETLRRMSGKKS